MWDFITKLGQSIQNNPVVKGVENTVGNAVNTVQNNPTVKYMEQSPLSKVIQVGTGINPSAASDIIPSLSKLVSDINSGKYNPQLSPILDTGMVGAGAEEAISSFKPSTEYQKIPDEILQDPTKRLPGGGNYIQNPDGSISMKWNNPPDTEISYKPTGGTPPPAGGGNTTTPAGGGNTTTPAGGGNTTTPAGQTTTVTPPPGSWAAKNGWQKALTIAKMSAEGLGLVGLGAELPKIGGILGGGAAIFAPVGKSDKSTGNITIPPTTNPYSSGRFIDPNTYQQQAGQLQKQIDYYKSVNDEVDAGNAQGQLDQLTTKYNTQSPVRTAWTTANLTQTDAQTALSDLSTIPADDFTKLMQQIGGYQKWMQGKDPTYASLRTEIQQLSQDSGYDLTSGNFQNVDALQGAINAAMAANNRKFNAVMGTYSSGSTGGTDQTGRIPAGPVSGGTLQGDQGGSLPATPQQFPQSNVTPQKLDWSQNAPQVNTVMNMR